MAEPQKNQLEQELLSTRQSTLRALTFVHSQAACLADHITGIEQKIRCLEQDLEFPEARRRKAA
jgi:hypothetical protein